MVGELGDSLKLNKIFQWKKFGAVFYLADPEGLTGQSYGVKIAHEEVVESRGKINIFGADYPTNDLTCIRDYTHATEPRDAYVKALEYLEHNSG